MSMRTKNVPIRPMARSGQFTRFDNAILDYVMPSLASNAWKVLCVIIRKTRGWHKTADAISYTQIQKASGIKSFSTINAALDKLVEAGYIICYKSKDRFTANTYLLNENLIVTATDISLSRQTGTPNSVVATATDIGARTATECVDTKERKENKKEREGDTFQGKEGLAKDILGSKWDSQMDVTTVFDNQKVGSLSVEQLQAVFFAKQNEYEMEMSKRFAENLPESTQDYNDWEYDDSDPFED